VDITNCCWKTSLCGSNDGREARHHAPAARGRIGGSPTADPTNHLIGHDGRHAAGRTGKNGYRFFVRVWQIVLRHSSTSTKWMIHADEQVRRKKPARQL
jgi:hypothetical protein